MIKTLLALLLPVGLWSQPTLLTQTLNGAERAVVLHAADGSQVTDDAPATPGESLIVHGSGFGPAPQVFAGSEAADTFPIDDADVQFTLPADAGSSFLGLAVANDAGYSNSATLPVDVPADATQLSASDVQSVVTSAAMAAAGDGMAIVVVDRPGNILAVFRRPLATAATIEKALSLARAGAFFSSFRTLLTSRTVRAISRNNFPEGIPNQPSGALYGIENTNRGCDFNVTYLPGQAFPRETNATGTGYSQGIGTVPGGITLLRDGVTVIGGIGVAGLASDDADEFAALNGAINSLSPSFLVHMPLPDPGRVYLDGFLLPAVNPISPPPPDVQPATTLGGVFDSGPRSGAPAPEGWLVGPLSSPELSADDVMGIIVNAFDTASLTRAAIRLPVGQRTKMVISVSDLNGNILGLYRMQDSTIFSVDVALTKARNVVYFSGPNRDPQDLPGVPFGTAVTNRTIDFGSQIYFPSGIWNTQPGPFYPMYLADIANPCTQGHQPPNPNQSGIVFFPGSTPLYRNGQMIGGLGVSGDGVEQDDFVTSGGAVGFEAPPAIRADQVVIRNVRLPYWKFPRNPEQ